MDHKNQGEKSAIQKTQYSCQMHPEIIREMPGICPICGMDLLPKKSTDSKQAGMGKHEGHNIQMFARKFWVSLVLTIPVILYSELPMRLFSWQAPLFPGSSLLEFILGSIIFFYGGLVFLRGALREIKTRLPGMMILIGIAITAAYVYSVYTTLIGKPTLFWELTTLITVMLLGHWLEMRAVQGAQGALKELSKLLPDTAEVIRDGQTITVSIQELRVGDLMVIKPGSKIPADGQVMEGSSEVNESMISGESALVAKNIDSQVIAGTINGDGSLKVSVKSIGEQTFLAGVMRLVALAQTSKSKLQILSDRAAFYLTIIAISTGSITLVVWLFIQGPLFAVERMVAVLVIACPHALGLAVPLVASISTTMAAKNGLLIKQRLALEAARTVNIVLFDKTGTLTEGKFGVDAIIPATGIATASALQLAASVNQESEHPIAQAIVLAAKDKKIELLKIDDFKRLPGIGAQAMIGRAMLAIGSVRLLEQKGIVLSAEQISQIEKLAGQGKTIVYLLQDDYFQAAFALADIIRPESRQAINLLKKMGLKIAMITGDSEEVAAWVSKELDIDQYFSKVLPDQKSAKVKILQSQGLRVAMVGDGVNDAPALTQADVGIAIGAGTNVAIESAGIILVKNDPRDIPKIIRLSKLTYNKMVQNIFWATGYNIVALPLAAGVLAGQGLILQPALSAFFMSVSTVIVAINAMLLRRKKLTN